ncbi:hypothetical protein BC829DRAFT_189256 [Chytridium lagenaria]|nr:hypothetical protein BC829DRAFT_189256 [Chytridium lagenaria]
MNHPTNDRLHRRGGAIYRALGFGGKPKPTVNAANVAADRCAAFCREPSPAVDKSLDKRQWGADDAALWDLTADDVSFEESPAYDDDTAVAPEVEVVAEVKPKKAKYEAAAVWGNRCVCIRRGKIGFAKKMKDASNTCKTCGVDGDPFKGCVVKGKHGHGHGGLKGTRKYFVLKNAKWLDEPANVTTTTTTAAASLATATPVVAAHDKSSPKNKHIAGNAAAAADSLPTSTLLPTSTSLPTASMDHGFPGSHLFPKSRPTVAAVVAIFFAMLIGSHVSCGVPCLQGS